jgi:hypothetical protein
MDGDEPEEELEDDMPADAGMEMESEIIEEQSGEFPLLKRNRRQRTTLQFPGAFFDVAENWSCTLRQVVV